MLVHKIGQLPGRNIRKQLDSPALPLDWTGALPYLGMSSTGYPGVTHLVVSTLVAPCPTLLHMYPTLTLVPSSEVFTYPEGSGSSNTPLPQVKIIFLHIDISNA